MPVTRGFFRATRRSEGRLPPGQYDTGSGWPVLTAEATPRVDLEAWKMTVDGLVETADDLDVGGGPAAAAVDVHRRHPLRDDLVEVRRRLQRRQRRRAARGGRTRSPMRLRDGPLQHRLHHQPPLSDVTEGKAWMVWEYGGQAAAREHGGPVRMLVPHLYFWKSAKWISRLELMTEDQPGFWERNGYHDRGDPWREQRYQGDA